MKSPKPSHPKADVPEAGQPAPHESAAGFPIVGIGASAGGLAAFEAFFSGIAADTDPGMAFVLVQHLAPDHKSILTDLVQRYTRMRVFEVEDGMAVQPNCVYIIPPNHDMAFLNGTLQLLEPCEPRGQRLPIDFFFRSLAQDLHARAIGIVLSGTGSDGTLGVRAIKSDGGMVMAQNPGSTEFDSMPRHALATGLVDYELPPAEMPAQLIAYATHAFGKLPRLATQHPSRSENALMRIFVLLRAQTGHDFSLYKPSTVNRRIERRLAVHQIETVDDYVQFLQQSPAEVEALFRDLLIGVTSFFRDPEAFLMLEQKIIPQLFADKPAGGTVRVWSPGCSTGEEAYSLAILLHERMETLKQNYTLQVFATDIDRQAIATARACRYPASIAADLSPERLARYFVAEPDGGGYSIHKGIRDLLVFSEQNVIKDPPFSRLDLISCRNLLIYFGSDLQKKLIPLFHYALNPRGLLFLGTSEGVGDFGDLFAVLDRKAKLFQRKDDPHALPRPALSRFLPHLMDSHPTLPRTAGKPAATAGGGPGLPVKPPLRELAERMLLQLSPACALVNGDGDLFYLHGRTGMFLEPAPGETGINNLLKMAREGLLPGLATALHRAKVSREIVRTRGLRVKTNGHFTLVNLSVHPVATGPELAGPVVAPETHLFLVVFEEAPTADPAGGPGSPVGDPAADVDARIAALTHELQAKDEYLQSTLEELETSNEELKSSNEEMQSVNEELQSSNEELETSKEEMQSVNEELATVNAELSTKVVDLSRLNNDMNNLLAGSGIATIFVDQKLRLLRFTPTAAQIINLIQSDVGRPVGHIVANLVGYDRLVTDVQAVLDTLVSIETRVQSTAGLWYTMRVRPYRTLENVIEGVVITFVDITEIKRTEETLEQANALLRLAAVVRDAHDAIVVQDLNGRILAWNPGAVRLYGWSETEALAMNGSERIPAALRPDALPKIHQLSRNALLEPEHTQRLTKAGAVVEVWMTATALVNDAGQMYAIETTERAPAGGETGHPP